MELQTLLGSSPTVFITLNGVIVAFAAWMTGAAIANSWKPTWQITFYCILLALASRFLSYALFQAPLLHLLGTTLAAACLVGIGHFSHRLNHARLMVSQYPWLYRRRGLLGYVELPPDQQRSL